VIIGTKTIPSAGRRVRTLLVHICDVCRAKFETFSGKCREKSIFTYCSPACLSLGRSATGPSGRLLETILVDRYGVSRATNLPQFTEARKNASISKFGVEFPLQNKDVAALGRSEESKSKKYQTRKKNGTIRRSYEEDKLYDGLCSLFGKEHVERWKYVNGWCIDLYVEPLDAYIQYDGLFWHGYDRCTEEIECFEKPVDVVIYKTILRDTQQNIWFASQKMNLIRVIGPSQIQNFLNLLI